MKENEKLKRILGGLFILLFISLGILIFSLVYEEELPKFVENINNGAIGAILTAIITVFLLSRQTQIEEEQERKSKVFEEKLSIYKDFLEKLRIILLDEAISVDVKKGPDEIKDLIFQLAQIKMHTESGRIVKIFKQVEKIIIILNEKNKNNAPFNYSLLSECLFTIVEEFQQELYGNILGKTEDISKEINSITDKIIESTEIIETQKSEIISDFKNIESQSEQVLHKTDDIKIKYQKSNYENWVNYSLFLLNEREISEDIIETIKYIHDDILNKYGTTVDVAYTANQLSFKNKNAKSRVKKFMAISPRKKYFQLWLNKNDRDQPEDNYIKYDRYNYYVELSSIEDYKNCKGSVTLRENKQKYSYDLKSMIERSIQITEQ